MKSSSREGPVKLGYNPTLSAIISLASSCICESIMESVPVLQRQWKYEPIMWTWFQIPQRRYPNVDLQATFYMEGVGFAVTLKKR